MADRNTKRILDSLADGRFPPQTFVHELAREPLEVQEKFIHTFMCYLELLTSYNRRGWMRGDLQKIAEWCDKLMVKREEKGLTEYHEY